jgi:hypothetical protein
LAYPLYYIDDLIERADSPVRLGGHGANSRFCLQIALIAIVLLAQFGSAQSKPKAIPTDEFANLLCSDEFRARIDHFLADISNQAGATGFVIGYADRAVPGRFFKYAKAFERHPDFRGFSKDRIKFVRGPDEDKMRFQLFVVPEGASLPNDGIGYTKLNVTSQTLFDRSYLNSETSGQIYFGGDLGGEPCDWGLDIGEFAQTLVDDPNLNGYLVVYSDRKSSRRFVMNAADSAIARITSHKVARDQLKIVYGGRAESRELQLWLIPKTKTFLRKSLPPID